MRIFDLRDWLELDRDDPSHDHETARRLRTISLAGSAGPSGAPWASTVVCRSSRSRGTCQARVGLLRIDLPATIAWRCPACRDAGELMGWVDSVYDLHNAPRLREATCARWPLTFSTIATLQRLPQLSRVAARIVYAAPDDGQFGVIDAPRAIIVDVANAAAARTAHLPASERAPLLDAIDELETLLGTHR